MLSGINPVFCIGIIIFTYYKVEHFNHLIETIVYILVNVHIPKMILSEKGVIKSVIELIVRLELLQNLLKPAKTFNSSNYFASFFFDTISRAERK